MRVLRKARKKAGQSGLPTRGLPHHDQEKIAKEGNYYLYYGLENRPNKSGVFVDPYQKFISFHGPDIGLRRVTLENRPDLQHYLDELKKGDIVEVTYTEALAISLEPAN